MLLDDFHPFKSPSRYESTIVSLFFGHTHYDEFELFYDTEDLGRAVGIAYIGPSVTPYYDLNPGYRIYYVDGDHKDTTRVRILFLLDNETGLIRQPLFYFPFLRKNIFPLSITKHKKIKQQKQNRTRKKFFFVYRLLLIMKPG